VKQQPVVNICGPEVEEHVMLQKHKDKGITAVQGSVNLPCPNI